MAFKYQNKLDSKFLPDFRNPKSKELIPGIVQLYLKFDGSDGDTTTIDEGDYSRTVNFISGQGLNCTISNEQAKYGLTSLKMANFCSIRWSMPEFSFDQDYTVEFWIFPLNSFSSQNIVFSSSLTNSNNKLELQLINSNQYILKIASGLSRNDSSGEIPINTWSHIAISHSAGENITDFYINGNLKQSFSNIPSGQLNETWFIGSSSQVSTYQFNGYIDSFKITSLSDKYQANFDPESGTGLAY